ncbi:hypothetical protein GOP47_0024982 [Adiantum capillus-veneris]|uniref:Uncharacterized protein n=1 Tax=Adiantum capillus-veneris TaxID=13818 RepID=A0A9D4Z4T6_ADICA|nr:hypothetical protein GOP47_0030842 [Adiantum capillus-veneris]KAI5060562.1 hypothetical protein GOP47_0024982 [Adiantum capillus-veneris]
MVWSLFEGDTWKSDLYGLPLMERSVVDMVEDSSITERMHYNDKVLENGYCSDFESDTSRILCEDDLCDSASIDDASVEEESSLQ